MGVNVTVKSYRPEIERKLIDQLWKNFNQVGAIVERQAKRNVSQRPPSHPQVDTGELRSSILHWTYIEGNRIGVSIGTHVYYGRHLELGTSHHPPYPWLFPAIEMQRDRIEEILLGRFTVSERE